MIRPLQYGLFFLLLLLISVPAEAAAREKTLFEGESAYTGMRVFEREGLRYLSFGNYWQTAIRPDDPAYLHFPYTRTAMAAFALTPEGDKRVLLVGLGGGAMATFIKRSFPEVTLDVVELDPMVLEVAQEYFGFQKDAMGEVRVGDGRTYLRKTERLYDIIFLDAYKAGELPFHLTTAEFMRLVRSRLKPEGVVAAHLWGKNLNRYFDAQIKTLQAVFPRVYLFEAGGGSFLLFGSRSDRTISRQEAVASASEIVRFRALPFDLGSLVAEQYRQVEEVLEDVPLLTDDFAPVNLLREQRRR